MLAAAPREREQEDEREHVGEREGAGDVHCSSRSDGESVARKERVGGAAAAAAVARSTGAARPSPRRGPPREPFRQLGVELAARQAAGRRQRACSSASAARDRVDVVGRRDHARARLADQVGGGAVGRDGGEDRPLGGEILEDLPGEDALAAAARVGDQQQQRLRVALQLERAARAARTGSARAGRRGRASPPTRGRRSGSRRRSGRRRPSSSRASAGRNGRGSRLPKNEPVCVIRKRGPRPVLEPGEVVEVAAVRDRRHRPARARARASPRRSPPRRTTIASAGEATRRATAPSTLSFARTASDSARRCGCATSESRRSATQRAPVAFACTAAPTKWTDAGGDRRDHDVDLLGARDPDRRRDRGQVPAHVLVGHEQAARGEPRLRRRTRRALPCRAAPRRACAPSARRSARGAPTPASARAARGRRWIHFGSSGASTCVSIPSAGRCVRELQRPLHAAAAGGREVERHEQHLHAPRWY